MALSARCATGHLSQRERQGVCTVSRLPLLRAKCRALPGCALYARLRADVMRELARRQASLRERLPLRHGLRRATSPDKGEARDAISADGSPT